MLRDDGFIPSMIGDHRDRQALKASEKRQKKEQNLLINFTRYTYLTQLDQGLLPIHSSYIQSTHI